MLAHYIAIAFMATHEIDALDKREWRLLPILNRLDDDLGKNWFVWLHVPLFAAIFALSSYREFQIVFDSFAIIHGGLHWLLRKHPSYEFQGWLSHGLIAGSSLFGAIHLAQLFL